MTDPAGDRIERAQLSKEARTDLDAARELRRRLAGDLKTDAAVREVERLSSLDPHATRDLDSLVMVTRARLLVLDDIIGQLEV